MDDVALLSPVERAEIFQQTAARKSISSVVAMEKDFWVCWLLRRLFEPPLVKDMVFKGGTSLSKIYSAIERFSEDVDLSIPREALGFSGAHDLTPRMSRTKRDRLLTDMRDACDRYVSGTLRESLTERIAEDLALTPTSVWSLDVADGDLSTLLFQYPAALSAEAYGAGGYIPASHSASSSGGAMRFGPLRFMRYVHTVWRNSRHCRQNLHATSTSWRSNGPSGKKRRSFTPNIIGRNPAGVPNGFRGTTPIWLASVEARLARARLNESTCYAPSSSTSRVTSLRVGQVTPKPCEANFTSSRTSASYPKFGLITR